MRRAWRISFMITGFVFHKKGAGRHRISDENIERVPEAFLRSLKNSVISSARQYKYPGPLITRGFPNNKTQILWTRYWVWIARSFLNLVANSVEPMCLICSL
ncbi:hypothetical protein NPIL_274051 [Nephila pilipes]|uniref:Uncharacterized protein n=1 Tax=Nephila pilipes TaxID=299642 RepID=A0A8X6IJL7_NEPPI|nr:hypothetical protein NPIL_274051 [Nephila pilipes]